MTSSKGEFDNKKEYEWRYRALENFVKPDFSKSCQRKRWKSKQIFTNETEFKHSASKHDAQLVKQNYNKA